MRGNATNPDTLRYGAGSPTAQQPNSPTAQQPNSLTAVKCKGKHFLFFFFTCCLSPTVTFSQNIGINTTGAAADAAALLEIGKGTLATPDVIGLLIPRVNLTATNNNAPIGAGIVTSLLVYNNAIAGTWPNNVTPGYYYWDGAQWVRFVAGANGGWLLSGNTLTGTLPASPNEWIGTINAADWILKTNNTERIRVQSAGNVGIGITPTVKLDVNGTIRTGSNGTDGQLIIYSEQGGTDRSITINPHAAMTQNVTYTLPPDDGTSGQALLTDGSGALTWGTPSGGIGGSVMLLYGLTGVYVPASCPAGWTESDYQRYDYEPTAGLKMVRSCYRTDANYQVLYLYGLTGVYVPASCPAGWTEADYQRYDYESTAGLKMVRTCYK